MNLRLRTARTLTALIGSMDFLTGLGLVLLPDWTLDLMRVADRPHPEVWMRFIGAFVLGVGMTYLWSALRARGPDAAERLRGCWELTALVRLSVGTLTATAIIRGDLQPAWVSVPLSDLGLAALQFWLALRWQPRDARHG